MLGQKYDAVQCLFSSIGYLTGRSDVIRALECLARHLAPGEAWMAAAFRWRYGSDASLK